MPNTQFGMLHLPPPCKLHALVELNTKCTKVLSPLMLLLLLTAP